MMIDSAALRRVIQSRLDQARIAREAATTDLDLGKSLSLVGAYRAVIEDIAAHERAAEIGLDAVRKELSLITKGHAA